MDKSYLKCFCLCFKCLKFCHKKIYIQNKNCPVNLNTNTTNGLKKVILQSNWYQFKKT